MILLESAIRNCDNNIVTLEDVNNVIDWQNTSAHRVEIPFRPARILLEDFTGVPALVDLACTRDTMNKLGIDCTNIYPSVAVDVVVDNSAHVDVTRSLTAFQSYLGPMYTERYAFLKSRSTTFCKFRVVPPGSGIMHQVNLEYLAGAVHKNDGNNILYPDSIIGTNDHITMIGGLGVAGWAVGEIDIKAAMLGQPVRMILPRVVGFELSGKLKSGVTATDLGLTVTQKLRKHGVVDMFVEFYGDGMCELSLDDRVTIASMSPVYEAIMGFFPVDDVTLQYLSLFGRGHWNVKKTESYLRANKMFLDHNEEGRTLHVYSRISQKLKTVYLVQRKDLSEVENCISGPKKPHNCVPIKEMKAHWRSCLDEKVGLESFGVAKESQGKVVKFSFNENLAELKHGSVVITVISSYTNTSNLREMLGAGLVAKKAHELGLQVKPWITTSLVPGSEVVKNYLFQSGMDKYLREQGFHIVEYGCTMCTGTGDLDDSVASAISKNDITAVAVHSGNWNSKGKLHPLVHATYLASPPLVVAYALAGTIDINFEKEPIGMRDNARPIYFRDIWPSTEDIDEVTQSCDLKSCYKGGNAGDDIWKKVSIHSLMASTPLIFINMIT